jgi:hypothetical protein
VIMRSGQRRALKIAAALIIAPVAVFVWAYLCYLMA